MSFEELRQHHGRSKDEDFVLGKDDEQSAEEIARIALARADEDAAQKIEDLGRAKEGKITWREMKEMNDASSEETGVEQNEGIAGDASWRKRESARIWQAKLKETERQRQEDLKRIREGRITNEEIERMNKESELEEEIEKPKGKRLSKQARSSQVVGIARQDKESISSYVSGILDSKGYRVGSRGSEAVSFDYSQTRKDDFKIDVEGIVEASQKKERPKKNKIVKHNSSQNISLNGDGLSSRAKTDRQIVKGTEEEDDRPSIIAKKTVDFLQKPVSRREFGDKLRTLGKAGLSLAVFGGLVGGIKKAKDWWGEDSGESNPDKHHNHASSELPMVDKEKLDDDDDEIEPTPDQELKHEENAKAIYEIINYDSPEEMEFGEAEAEALTRYWYNRYSDQNDLLPQLKRAYSDIMSWVEIQGEADNIRNIFQREFVDKVGRTEQLSDEKKNDFFRTYLALLITESSGDPRAKSDAGAEGVGQIMPFVARDHHLKKYYNVNESFDPNKNSYASSKHFLEKYRLYGDSKRWLHSYNGFVGKYHTEVKSLKSRGKVVHETDAGFYKFMTDDMNRERDEAKFSKAIFHKVRRRETLSKIAGYYGITTEQLLTLNRQIKSKDKIGKGDLISLPTTEGVRKKYFYRRISGHIENLNYVKVQAIKKVIADLERSGELPSKKKELVVRKHKKVEVVRKEISARMGKKVKKGAIYKIAKEYKVPVEKIVKLNNLEVDEKRGVIIEPGQRLLIIPPTFSLEEIAGGNKKELERLCELNPKIIDKDLPIPPNTIIRM